jgi:pyruvoyl-dependent arginine decarboxylase (PvlArgDC)
MSAEYKNHTYNVEAHGKQSQARGYTFERVLLFVDGVQIPAVQGTLYEHKSFGGKPEEVRHAARAHAEEAAKRIIGHLVAKGIIIHQLYSQ